MTPEEKHVFDVNFDQTLQRLHLLASKDDFSIDSVERELETLYKYEGLDWTGRGELKQAELSGRITACQAFIHRWSQRDAGSADTC